MSTKRAGGRVGGKFRMSLALPVGAVINCADNSGAKNLYVIAVSGIKGECTHFLWRWARLRGQQNEGNWGLDFRDKQILYKFYTNFLPIWWWQSSKMDLNHEILRLRVGLFFKKVRIWACLGSTNTKINKTTSHSIICSSNYILLYSLIGIIFNTFGLTIYFYSI